MDLIRIKNVEKKYKNGVTAIYDLNLAIEKGSFVFIIGGSLGLSDKVKKTASLHLSFGKITLPHQLMRVILLEQIYRGYKINNNETYHK